MSIGVLNYLCIVLVLSVKDNIVLKRAMCWSNVILRNWVFSTLECLYFLFLFSFFGFLILSLSAKLNFKWSQTCFSWIRHHVKILDITTFKNVNFWPKIDFCGPKMKKKKKKVIFIFGTTPNVKPYYIRTW